MEKVVETHNLFIDTSCAAKESGSTGDDFQLHLNTHSIDAEPGQFIRLTLNNFGMYKTWTDVNANNDTFHLVTDQADTTLNLDNRNYLTIREIGNNFATKLAAQLLADAQAGGSAATEANVTLLTPEANTTPSGTTDNIISFTIEFDADHDLTQVDIRFLEAEGDTYALLGGNRLFSNAGNSVTTDFTTASRKITVSCLYPGQRNTTGYLYLRTSLTTGASETASLALETDIDKADEVQYSNILAKILVNTEFCVYDNNGGEREYFIELHQRHINNIRLFVTDHHNRRLGRRPTVSSKTATGTGNAQSTLGNLSFNCVIRADIVQRDRPGHALFPPDPNNTLARQTGVLMVPNKPPL